MMKILATAMISSAVTAVALSTVQPTVASALPQEPVAQSAKAWIPPIVSMPLPQEPYDMTPITPFETVGGLAYEPF